MSHEQGFLDAILADPADDTVRLIYADWLEERGDPRGEFIRVQCERARLPPRDVEHTSAPTPPPGHGLIATCRLVCGGPRCKLLGGDAFHLQGCRWAGLRDREQELFGRYGHDWFGNLRGRPALAHWTDRGGFWEANGWQWQARRGFLASIRLSQNHFRLFARSLFGAHPIETVRLTDLRPQSWREITNSGNELHCGWGRLPGWIQEGDLPLLPFGLLADQFPSEDAALAAMNRYLVAYGRDKAGLPPWPKH